MAELLSPLKPEEEMTLQAPPHARPELKTGLLTGGFDRPYAFGMAMALAAQGLTVDVIGSSEVDSPEMHSTPGLNFLNLQGDPREKLGFAGKLKKLARSYLRLLRYAATTDAKVLHILWNNKVQLFDRTLLMLYYKALGKKIVLTAHNVNVAKRDGNDSWLNRTTLRTQYRLANHIFVHTGLMKSELLKDFGVRDEAVSVIPFGINNSVPDTDLTPQQAKAQLGIESGTKTILFFGAIRPYKGLEELVNAFLEIAGRHPEYRLLIIGDAKKGCEQYLRNILDRIARDPSRKRVITRTHFVPDSETELYFKAADVVALPYLEIFQSGVLFLSYSFGVPVVASDIGAFRDDVVDGRNGFLYDPADAGGLAGALEKYFASAMFTGLEAGRARIRDEAEQAHSWETVGRATRAVYEELAVQ